MRKRKEKQKGKKRKEKRNKKEKNSYRERKGKGETRKGKGKISRLSGGRSSTVRGLKLVHATRSTCGHQKVGVSTTFTR